jgi:hypothetical protein
VDNRRLNGKKLSDTKVIHFRGYQKYAGTNKVQTNVTTLEKYGFLFITASIVVMTLFI